MARRKKMSHTPVWAALLLLAVVAMAAVEPHLERGALDDRLWTATVRVESSGNPWAVNPETGASGIVQIMPECVDDCNRIAQARGLAERFTQDDRFNPAKSHEMWLLYLSYWGREYERTTGWPPSNEVYARMWNGGPTGWKKEATVSYWHLVHRAMPATATLDIGSEPPADEAP